MSTTCPSCGARNSLLRVFLYWTGFHLRCGACRTVYRLVETAGGMFGVFGAFGLVYLASLWAVVHWWPEAAWRDPLAPIWVAGLPALPGVVAALLAMGWLGRLPKPEDQRFAPLSRVGFVGTYVVGTAMVAAIVSVLAFGILMTRFGERLPPVRAQVHRVDAVDVPDDQAARFAFVDLEGVRRTLADLRGSVVFVHIFDPEHGTARPVLDTIRALRKTAVDDGVLFVLAAQTEDAELRAFAARAPSLPYVFTTAPLPAAFPALADERPATFVLDADGRVVLAQTGAANWATDEVRQFLGELARGR